MKASDQGLQVGYTWVKSIVDPGLDAASASPSKVFMDLGLSLGRQCNCPCSCTPDDDDDAA